MFLIFKILPVLTLVTFAAGVVFISRGISRGGKKQRLLGAGCIAASVVLLIALVLLGLAQM